jgi:hypothetical protein
MVERMFKFFEFFVFILIISKVLIIGVTTTCISFCEFYEFNIPKIVTMITSKNIYDNTLTSYIGFDTGYGFFAPNVSSNFIILSFSQKEKKMFISTDLLKTTEGKSRFSSINDIFLKNIDSDREKIKINHTILEQINRYFEKKYHSGFETSVYLYVYPNLQEFVKNKKEKLIKIDSIK